MSEPCVKCKKEIDGVYHCIACCTNIDSSSELRAHADGCPKAVFLNPLDEESLEEMQATPLAAK